jgi:putative DNA methylase
MTQGGTRKLIEVAMPLAPISDEASLRKRKAPAGYPTTIHRWWAQRPVAACRAVLFASLVDDPTSDPERFPTAELIEAERDRLFGIIEQLVLWENTSNEAVLAEARDEILRSTGGHPPPVLDPFSGGGSIPLEAQRLGLTAYASDLNPVAVLITKALIEIPPRFADRPPVHPEARKGVGATGTWSGAAGLAEDVRRYGAWMRDEAERRIGHLYPKAQLPKEQGGGEATVIAWLWARTVTCPNPACRARMPLVRSFALSTKKGKEAWVQPVIDGVAKTVRFEVRTGTGGPPEPPKVGRGANFRCLVCEQVSPDEHIKAEGRAGRMDAQLMAIVAEGQRSRIYLPPTEEHEAIARSAEPAWAPDEELPTNPRWFSPPDYGMPTYRDLFTPRQLVALTTFGDLAGEVREIVRRDARTAGLADDGVGIDAEGTGAFAYADAVATYLGLALSRHADYGNSLASWRPKDSAMRALFARQAIPMVWDFAEGSPFGSSSSGYIECVAVVSEALTRVPASVATRVTQADATDPSDILNMAICTDPPYYDNIGYADLSDFFYVWLRRSLRGTWPDVLSTVLTPKTDELVATPYRFEGDRALAEEHFESGLLRAFRRMRELAHPDIPLTVFYAFKQTESDDGEAGRVAAVSTGWETMLTSLVTAGFAIARTWPLRTEGDNRQLSVGTNALASSIVLVCRPRPGNAPLATRREFAQALSSELPVSIAQLQATNIAPVDLAQAAIGPGMAVFSRYSGVLEASGERMRVHQALQLINAELDAYLTSEHGDLDSDTRWCHTWFGSHGFGEAPYGAAETLATARNVSVAGLEQAGVLRARGGKVRLLRPEELDRAWDPLEDTRLTVWECTHQLVRELHDPHGGIEGAARLVARMGTGRATEAKDLAYGLYGIADRMGWAADAGAYNDLVTDWPAITERARELGTVGQQAELGI